MLLVAGLTALPLEAYSKGFDPSFETHMSKVCLTKCANPVRILDAAQNVAKDLELDPIDILAIMQVESGFKPMANNNGSVGLMQVNLHYHKRKFKTSPYDLEANIFVGASVYKACLIKRNNNKAQALRCYNGETRKDMIYPNKVLKVIRELNLLFIL